MELLYALIGLCLAVLAFGLSIVSLGLHWIKRAESPLLAPVYTELNEMKTQHLDLLDKVEHWRKRDNVRRARQGAEDKLAAPEPSPETPENRKSHLRALAASRGLGVVSK